MKGNTGLESSNVTLVADDKKKMGAQLSLEWLDKYIYNKQSYLF